MLATLQVGKPKGLDLCGTRTHRVAPVGPENGRAR
jgi:hypothetical protein